MNLFQWLRYRKAVAQDKEFTRGYEWAAGQLLTNRYRPSVIAELEAKAHSIDNTPFDRGVRAALAGWWFYNNQ